MRELPDAIAVLSAEALTKTVGQLIIPQNVKVVPELLDKLGGVAGHVNSYFNFLILIS